MDAELGLLANRRSVMTLYSGATDPASHAVRLVLAEKAINVEVVHVSDGDKPEDLARINPYETVLTLVDRDLVLYEPQIIMEYLDERFPHPPLMPVDPVSRASNRLYRYRVQHDMYPLIEVIERGDRAAAEEARRRLREQLTALAPALGQRRFFMSEDFSLGDCVIAPVLWRLGHLGVKLPRQAKPLLQFALRLFEREAFDASLSEPEREMRL